jgi:hypothetical protein
MLNSQFSSEKMLDATAAPDHAAVLLELAVAADKLPGLPQTK